MKEYMTNNELIDYLSSKGVIIENKDKALQRIERYTYYSIVNIYKSIFKDKNGNYIDNVTFDEIYSLFEFDKNIKNIILKNLTTIRNVAAHSDRLYNYTSKFYLSFKLIDKNHVKSDNITNLYMVIRCMEKLLTKEQYEDLYSSILKEVELLDKKLKSINMSKVLKIMGFPMNND